MSWFHVLGDAAWIVAMALISSASLTAWKRIAPDAQVPLFFSRSGQAARRASRTTAFGVRIGWAFVVGAALMVMDRINQDSEVALMSFGMRLFLASIFPLAHLAWLRAVTAVLDEEGQLRP